MATRVVNTRDAESRLSEPIRDAEQGVEVIIARNGHPVAALVPWNAERPAWLPGAWASRVHGSDDAVSTAEEVVAMFEQSAATTAP